MREDLKIQEKVRRYEAILNSLADGVIIISRDMRTLWANKTIMYLYGNREGMYKRKCYDFFYGLNEPCPACPSMEVFADGKPHRRIQSVIAQDNKPRWRNVRANPYYDEDNNLLGSIEVISDNTKTKMIEKALQENEERFRDISYSMADWIWEVDSNGKYTFASGKVKDILGYDPEELIGKTPFEIMPEDEAKRIGEVFKKITSEKKPIVDLENWNLTKEGKRVCLLTYGVPIFDESGELTGYRGVDKNITDRKLAEEARSKLEDRLRHAERMESIGTLAGGMAHNFNNLLMNIMGNTSLMLLETDSAHPNYQRLTSIEKSVQSGSKLTSQLLGYARGGRYEVRPISLNQLIKDISETFGVTRKEISVHQELADDLYGIKADQGQIEQVLLNLYVNAADAMPGGGDLFLKTMNVTDKEMIGKPYKVKAGNHVLLTVRDTGVGMDKETMERIFDPFFTTKDLSKGTGLGLASVYGIVKAHSGFIDVESEEGHGTAFSICLPAIEKEVKEEKELLSGEFVKGKETILLVDDEDMILDTGEQMLRILGYEVLLAMSGQEALELYKKNQDKIDIVLMDMVMPGMGGGETYNRMKEINSNVKVLLLSGYSIEGEATEILERGCDGFMHKPFNLKELSQKIREILDERKNKPKGD